MMMTDDLEMIGGTEDPHQSDQWTGGRLPSSLS